MKILIVHNYYKLTGGEDEVVDFENYILENNGYKVIKYYKYSRIIDSFFKNLKLFF